MHPPVGGESTDGGFPPRRSARWPSAPAIKPISRTEGGYRLFGEEVFAELTLIRTLKAMEIPLPDVRQILESRRSGVCTCRSLQDTIRRKAGEIERKIAALRHVHQELHGLLSSWEGCGGRKPSAA